MFVIGHVACCVQVMVVVWMSNIGLVYKVTGGSLSSSSFSQSQMDMLSAQNHRQQPGSLKVLQDRIAIVIHSLNVSYPQPSIYLHLGLHRQRLRVASHAVALQSAAATRVTPALARTVITAVVLAAAFQRPVSLLTFCPLLVTSDMLKVFTVHQGILLVSLRRSLLLIILSALCYL